MAAHRSRGPAPAVGSSQARSVTGASIAASRPTGSRPSRRTVRTGRDFCFAAHAESPYAVLGPQRMPMQTHPVPSRSVEKITGM
ncbi:hypothetical protein FHS38_003503 [Streptomyces netropsis]|uniref:Uncharacterized protein n=1 Tax=Streptomyces netropsis TaxID=55404 RepID=A0A7W7PEX8_STRNE|nr:hypothetical protein [Streptomyces netropsis]GGR10399.1 hypothetical protein GCM10010219_13860 [Streptomyces netropsis]